MKTEILEQKNDLTISLEHYFEEFENQAREWSEKAQQIQVTDVSQTDLMLQAREARLGLRNIRIAVDRKHKELKEDALKTGQILDGIKRRLIGYIEPTETYLEKQEKFKEVLEASQKQELIQDRLHRLSEFTTDQSFAAIVGDMNSDAFDNLLIGYKASAEQKIKDAEQFKKDQEEVARIAAEKELRRKEEVEALRKENEKLEAQRKSDRDAAEKERLKSEEKLKAEREKRKQAEEEIRVKAEKEDQDRKEKIAAERKLKRAPDKVKLLSLAEQISLLPLPEMKEQESREILLSVQGLLAKVVRYINDKTENL